MEILAQWQICIEVLNIKYVYITSMVLVHKLFG